MATDIRDLPISAEGDRVVTKHLPATPEVVVRYPRPSSGLSADEKFRFASLTKKGLAHLGYGSEELDEFVRGLRMNAQSEQDAWTAPTLDEDDLDGEEVVIAGRSYTLHRS